MNAARLTSLSAAGVDDRVIDLLIALAYPEKFSIKPSPTAVGELAVTGGGGGSVYLGGGPLVAGGFILDPCGPYYTGLSLYGWDNCSPYGYTAYGYGAWGYYGGGGGWYDPGGGGGIIVVPTPPQAHGQVVNGRGYLSGDTGSGGGGSSGGGSSSSSGSSGSGGGGGFSGSSGGDRTAVPR
jgi:hypothetical protein